MLILSRRVGERLILTLPDGRTIAVSFEGMRGNQARLGIEAERDVLILREELKRYREDNTQGRRP